MKPMKILFALSLLAVTQQVVAEDEYDYRPVPSAEQIADLQDEDNDGVINARDMCPGTPEGSEVDNDGCGEYIKASDNMQVRILFANDSDEINPVFRRQVSNCTATRVKLVALSTTKIYQRDEHAMSVRRY
jgi:outer membrane protein OmpA-like peptidoglycan-associated protein